MRQSFLAFVAREGLEWRGGENAAEIPDHRLDHKSAPSRSSRRTSSRGLIGQDAKWIPFLKIVHAETRHCFGRFDFANTAHKLPDTTFSGRLTRRVGNKTVELIEVGPAHTGGDAIVWVPPDRTVFTGDILFIDGHPIVWAGPVGNWIAACETILALDAQAIVPGHGPLTDARGVERVRDYQGMSADLRPATPYRQPDNARVLQPASGIVFRWN
ncbi:MAG TPA: MBL fold metallo-hydrolase [Rhizomicrobium sp.]